MRNIKSGDLFLGSNFTPEPCVCEINSWLNQGRDYTNLTSPKLDGAKWNLMGPISSPHSYVYIGNSSFVENFDKIKELLTSPDMDSRLYAVEIIKSNCNAQIKGVEQESV